jgi:hypothetical protein
VTNTKDNNYYNHNPEENSYFIDDSLGIGNVHLYNTYQKNQEKMKRRKEIYESYVKNQKEKSLKEETNLKKNEKKNIKNQRVLNIKNKMKLTKEKRKEKRKEKIKEKMKEKIKEKNKQKIKEKEKNFKKDEIINEIKKKETWDSIKYVPENNIIFSKTEVIKTIWDIKKNILYFMNTTKYFNHYDYLKKELSYKTKLIKFNDDNYSINKNREFILGSLTFYSSLNKYSFELFPDGIFNLKKR